MSDCTDLSLSVGVHLLCFCEDKIIHSLLTLSVNFRVCVHKQKIVWEYGHHILSFCQCRGQIYTNTLITLTLQNKIQSSESLSNSKDLH